MFHSLLIPLGFFALLTMTLVTTATGPTHAAGESGHALCATCHVQNNRATEKAEAGKASFTRPCVECHREILGASGGSQSIGPAYSGHAVSNESGERRTAPLGGKSFDNLDCLTCHVPHSQGEPKHLRLDPNRAATGQTGKSFDRATRLCLSCHPIAAEFKASGRGYMRHPVGIPVRKAGRNLDDPQFPPLVDVKGTPDPSDDVIGCTTCHHVHTSRNPFMLRWRVEELSAACLKCHPEVAPSKPGDVRGPLVRR